MYQFILVLIGLTGVGFFINEAVSKHQDLYPLPTGYHMEISGQTIPTTPLTKRTKVISRPRPTAVPTSFKVPVVKQNVYSPPTVNNQPSLFKCVTNHGTYYFGSQADCDKTIKDYADTDAFFTQQNKQALETQTQQNVISQQRDQQLKQQQEADRQKRIQDCLNTQNTLLQQAITSCMNSNPDHPKTDTECSSFIGPEYRAQINSCYSL
jgi:hypothetical protein